MSGIVLETALFFGFALFCFVLLFWCCGGMLSGGEDRVGDIQNMAREAPDKKLTAEERRKVILEVLKRSEISEPTTDGDGGEKGASSSTGLEEVDMEEGTLRPTEESFECDGSLGDATAEITAEISMSGEEHDESQLHTIAAASTIRSEDDEEEGQSNPDDSCCCICLSSYEKGDKILSMSLCKHSFHEECLMPWLDKTNDCPYCREQFVSFPDYVKASKKVLTEERFSHVFSDLITSKGRNAGV